MRPGASPWGGGGSGGLFLASMLLINRNHSEHQRGAVMSICKIRTRSEQMTPLVHPQIHTVGDQALGWGLVRKSSE